MSYENKNVISSSTIFGDNSSAFVFTNENIRAYMQHVGDLTDKNVLTVAASGDHAFGAYLAGARHVETFDVNSVQRPIAELKRMMIKNLPYEDFMEFFFSTHKTMNPRILAPIMRTMGPHMQQFLMQMYGNPSTIRWYSNQTSELVPYLVNKSVYETLRGRLPDGEIKFVHTDIKDVTAKFDGKYDLIMLSNICASMYPCAESMDEIYTNYYNDILAPMADKLLNPGGKICFDYQFRLTSLTPQEFYTKGQCNVEKARRTLGAKCPHTFSVHRVTSSTDRTAIDLLMTMHKSRTI